MRACVVAGGFLGGRRFLFKGTTGVLEEDTKEAAVEDGELEMEGVEAVVEVGEKGVETVVEFGRMGREGVAVGSAGVADGADDGMDEVAVGIAGFADEDVVEACVGAEGVPGAGLGPQFSFVLHLGSKHMVNDRLPLRCTETWGVPQDSQILFNGLIRASFGNGYNMRHWG